MFWTRAPFGPTKVPTGSISESLLLTGYKIDIKPESQVEFVDSEGDDVEADQETTNDNVSNEETPESIAEQIEDDPSDTFPNGEDVNSALNDDADKDEE